MKNKTQTQGILHSPNLRTVLMVEKVLKNSDVAISREEIKRKLPVQIMHQTLNAILSYFEDHGMIIDSHKGVIWTYNPSPKLDRIIREGTET